jgi:transposase
MSWQGEVTPFDGAWAMGYWAKAPLGRDQVVLFSPTLEAMISDDHPVRLFDEMLARVDWTAWEAKYHGRRGQPPIHPRIVAGVLLYGLSRGVRSSRHLEYLIGNNLDFMWLVEGRRIDHSTLCAFRKEFREPLKGLFRQVCHIALTMGLIRLNEVALDGTRIKANNDRSETLTAAGLQQRLAALDVQIEAMLREAEQADAAEAKLFDTGKASQQLPPELAELKARQAKLQQAFAEVQAADKARRSEGIDPQKRPAQIPTTDADSKVLPNKEGGYAPNYTPMAATDAHRGFIIDADVLRDTNEQLATLPAIDRIQENLGQTPERALADGLHATGENMLGMEQRGVEFFSPVTSHQPQPGNPACREDPTQPVPESEWEKLPRSPQTKKLDKACFVYNEQADRYYCPQGRVLEYDETKSSVAASGQRTYFRVYRSVSCEGCPLSAACRMEKAVRGRSISRDVHEKRREQMALKMARPEAKAIYQKRFHAAETPFGIIKHLMNVRQFLLRGLENVKTEWLWVCTAFNLAKLVREVARLLAKFAQLVAMEEV